MEKSRNLVQGDKLHLECKIQSHPYATVFWKKDNETMKNDVSNRVFLNSNRTLIIYDLQFSDKGDYTCVATNSVNSTSMTVLVRVKGETILIILYMQSCPLQNQYRIYKLDYAFVFSYILLLDSSDKRLKLSFIAFFFFFFFFFFCEMKQEQSL